MQEIRECFYCHKRGHVISDCMTLKRKQMPGQPKLVGLVNNMNARLSNDTNGEEIDMKFMPFLMKGFISLNGDRDSQQEVNILRDTGAALSFVVSDVLPLSEQTSCGSHVLIQRIEMGTVKVPLHRIQLQCELITAFVNVILHCRCYFYPGKLFGWRQGISVTRNP